MGRKFEDMQIGTNSLQERDYTEFRAIADEFMKKIKNPFISRIANFVHEKYGGSISIKPRLMKEIGAESTIDMLVNFGIRYDDDDESPNSSRLAHEAYSKSNIFCKVSEGRMSKEEVMEFLDLLDSFGIRVIKKGKMIFVPYFPTRAVIIAREIPDEVREHLDKLPKEEGALFVDGSHIFAGRGNRGTPKNHKCYVDVYEWHDDGTATQIQF